MNSAAYMKSFSKSFQFYKRLQEKIDTNDMY